MNTRLRHLGLLALAPLLLRSAPAALNPATISADAKWVAYANLDAIRESTLGHALLERWQKEIQPAAPTTGVQLDVQRMLQSISQVTAYGANFSPDATLVDGTLVIEGTPALRELVEGWLAQATLTAPLRVSEVTDLPFPAYTLEKEVYLAFPPEPIILIGKSKTHLVKARDAFRGAAPSLAQNASSPLTQRLAQAGSAFAVAASVVPAEQLFTGDAPPARVLELVDSGLLTLSEADRQTTLLARLNARSDANADKLTKILQGLTAMLSLAETSDRNVADFLKAVSVDRQGTGVALRVSYSSERLVQMLDALHQPKSAQTAAAATAASRQRYEATFGQKLVEWKLDKAGAQTAPSAETLAEFKIEKAQLTTGAKISVVVYRNAGAGNGIVDMVEIVPDGGSGSPLRFEAENMGLAGFAPRNVPVASSGRAVAARGARATAQFEFPGTPGTYTIRVRYFEEAAGTTTLAVYLKAPPAAPATP